MKQPIVRTHFLNLARRTFFNDWRTFIAQPTAQRILAGPRNGLPSFIMAPRNRRWKQLKAAREALPQKKHGPSEVDPSEGNVDLHFLTDDEEDEDCIAGIEKSILQWREGAGKHLRATYTGSSRTTEWRKKKAKEARVSSMSNAHKITQYFRPVQAPPTVSDHLMSGERNVVLSELDPQPEKLSVEEALQKLSLLTNLSHSREKEKGLNTMTKFDFVRYLAIENYFILLKKKTGKVMASMEVAASHFRHRKSGSQARRIRFWADYFLVHQTLPVYRQGCHVKTRSLILDEDVIAACRTWLRSQVSDALCGAAFANWLGSQLHLNLNLSNPVNVSVPTAVRWMHELGLRYIDFRRGVYNDGHEREDVVQYRELFLRRMEGYQRRMATFVDENLEIVIEPELNDGERKLVLVTHDESCFSSNDGRKTVWMDQDHNILRPKGEGRSLMVSAFLCECHGLLQLPTELADQNPDLPKEALVIIKPGKNCDGYWKNSDLVNQVERLVMPIFNVLHPGCDALFMFDNSQNHHALPPDALNAKILPLKDNGVNVKPQRNGWYIDSLGVQRSQIMVNENGQPLGLKSILTGRGLWDCTLSLQGARQLLSEQPDFCQQKEWLQDVIEKHDGFIIDYYPKFHCEFNFIEMFWAACKSYTRRNCTYSFRDLQNVVPLALKSVEIAQIRRFARKCYRYMDAYRLQSKAGKPLTSQQIEYAVKKYKSHRRFPMRIYDDFE